MFDELPDLEKVEDYFQITGIAYKDTEEAGASICIAKNDEGKVPRTHVFIFVEDVIGKAHWFDFKAFKAFRCASPLSFLLPS